MQCTTLKQLCFQSSSVQIHVTARSIYIDNNANIRLYIESNKCVTMQRQAYLHWLTNVIIFLMTFVCWCQFWCTGNREVVSNRKDTSCLPLLNAVFQPRVPNRLNARWHTHLIIDDQAKNSISRPYDQRAFTSLDPTADMASPLALAIYMSIGADFDALATGKWYRIEMRQVVFLCCMQDSNPVSFEPNVQQTECPLTNQLSCRGSS